MTGDPGSRSRLRRRAWYRCAQDVLREAICGLVRDCRADRALSEQHSDDLNAIAARPDPVPRITVSREVCCASEQPTAAALSAIARDAIQLLGGPHVIRLRECAAPTARLGSSTLPRRVVAAGAR